MPPPDGGVLVPGGVRARPPSKMIEPLDVVMLPLLVETPVISVCALRTETTAPGLLVKLPTICVDPMNEALPELMKLPVIWPKPLTVPPTRFVRLGVDRTPPTSDSVL